MIGSCQNAKMGHWTLCTDLHWEDWRDQCSLYQRVSGETHFLNPLGAAILRQLESTPSHLDGLCERLSMEFEIAPEYDYRAQVAASLTRFDELGLIQRQTSNETTA